VTFGLIKRRENLKVVGAEARLNEEEVVIG
jgi:hypothetical protein